MSSASSGCKCHIHHNFTITHRKNMPEADHNNSHRSNYCGANRRVNSQAAAVWCHPIRLRLTVVNESVDRSLRDLDRLLCTRTQHHHACLSEHKFPVMTPMLCTSAIRGQTTSRGSLKCAGTVATAPERNLKFTGKSLEVGSGTCGEGGRGGGALINGTTRTAKNDKQSGITLASGRLWRDRDE